MLPGKHTVFTPKFGGPAGSEIEIGMGWQVPAEVVFQNPMML